MEFNQQALSICREVGDKAGEGVSLNNFGTVYYSLGQYPKALEFNQQALSICREVGDKAGEGVSLNNFGTVYYSLGQYPKALEFNQQTLAIVREVGDKATYSQEGSKAPRQRAENFSTNFQICR